MSHIKMSGKDHEYKRSFTFYEWMLFMNNSQGMTICLLSTVSMYVL